MTSRSDRYDGVGVEDYLPFAQKSDPTCLVVCIDKRGREVQFRGYEGVGVLCYTARALGFRPLYAVRRKR